MQHCWTAWVGSVSFSLGAVAQVGRFGRPRLSGFRRPGLASGVGRIAGVVGRNYLISQGAPDTIPSPVSTPVWLMLFAIFFSMAIGVISGVYPAIRAVQLDPMMALKYE